MTLARHEQERRHNLEWAVQKWRDQVENRPLRNIHRRTLDGVWRQVIGKLGGDAQALIGPTHDELLSGEAKSDG